jgi:MerR HTH family regulatory protein
LDDTANHIIGDAYFFPTTILPTISISRLSGIIYKNEKEALNNLKQVIKSQNNLSTLSIMLLYKLRWQIMEEKLYPIHQFAKMIRVPPQTLRNWEKKGTPFPHYKSSNGYRYYTETQYRNFVGRGSETKKIVIGYCRDSSAKQKDDLERQVEHVRTYMIAKAIRLK